MLVVGCGGGVEPVTATDAGADTPDAEPSVWCVPDAAPDECGNIQRRRADGTVEDGCCVGATPVCRLGACVEVQR